MDPIQIKDGLLKLAAEFFKQDLMDLAKESETRPLTTDEQRKSRLRHRWLEEYKTKC